MPVNPDLPIDMDALRRVVASIGPDDRDLEDPPADLWLRISDEVSGSSAPAPSRHADSHHADSHHAEVIDLAERRSRRMKAVLAVAAAAVLIAGVAAVLIDRTDPGSEVVASAELDLLAGGGTGVAELVERDDGTHLVVDVADLQPTQDADFYELWMITPDVTDMVSVEKFDSDSEIIDVVVPDGIDPADFPVVDISEEVDDGDATHSGLSILRGTLA